MFIFSLLGMQLFGYKLIFCSAVEGSQPLCPPGVSGCPNHRDCYITVRRRWEGGPGAGEG